MKQLRDSFILRKKLRILFQDHFHFLLKFPNFLALSLQDCVFFFKHNKVSPQEFFDSIGMLIKLATDDFSSWARLLDSASKVARSLSHLTDLLINYISIIL